MKGERKFPFFLPMDLWEKNNFKSIKIKLGCKLFYIYLRIVVREQRRAGVKPRSKSEVTCPFFSCLTFRQNR